MIVMELMGLGDLSKYLWENYRYDLICHTHAHAHTHTHTHIHTHTVTHTHTHTMYMYGTKNHLTYHPSSQSKAPTLDGSVLA